MSEVFGLGKKMDDAVTKCMSCGAPLPENMAQIKRFTGGESTVFIIGDDSDASRQLFENTKKALKNINASVEAEYTSECLVASNYNISRFPALVINGAIVSQGIVSDTDEIENELEYRL